MAMLFQIQLNRGAQRYLSYYLGRGKFHLDPLTFHSMLHHTPKDYFYDYPVIEQCLAVPKCTTIHSEK
jgi:hypothetical protein